MLHVPVAALALYVFARISVFGKWLTSVVIGLGNGGVTVEIRLRCT